MEDWNEIPVGTLALHGADLRSVAGRRFRLRACRLRVWRCPRVRRNSLDNRDFAYQSEDLVPGVSSTSRNRENAAFRHPGGVVDCVPSTVVSIPVTTDVLPIVPTSRALVIVRSIIARTCIDAGVLVGMSKRVEPLFATAAKRSITVVRLPSYADTPGRLSTHRRCHFDR